MEEFLFKPKISYHEISAQDLPTLKPYLEIFRKGYLLTLEAHLMNSDGLQAYLTSSEVTPATRILFAPSVKEIDRALMNIVRQFSELEQSLSDAYLEKEARKFYFHFFQTSTIEEKKLRFCTMVCEYGYIKSFQQNVKESWGIIQKIFEPLSHQSSTHEFLQKVLTFRVYPCLELCEQTNLLLRRISYILQLEYKDKKERLESAKYKPEVDYLFDCLFLENIVTPLSESTENQNNATPEIPQVESCVKHSYLLDARGLILFNQSELYLLNIDKERFGEHETKIINCKFVESRLYNNEEESRRDIIRGLLIKGSTDQKKIYEKFLLSYFPRVQQKILQAFGSASAREQNIFLYHFTPSYFYKLTLNSLQKDRSGFIHLYHGRRRMIRELPYEYIKFVLKDWWDVQIFQQVQKTDRNSPEIIIKIRNHIYARWQSEKDILEKIQNEPLLARAFSLHDYHALRPFLENELSMLSYLLFLRFIGYDFIYQVS